MPTNQTPEVKPTVVKPEEIKKVDSPIEAAAEKKQEESLEAKAAEVKKEPSIAPVSEVAKSTSTKLKNHKERILDYVRGKSGDVKLNDFIKSFWTPHPGPREQGHENQGNMRKLRKDLMELESEGRLLFTSPVYQRLGDAYWPDNSGKTHYYHVGNTPIEAKLS